MSNTKNLKNEQMIATRDLNEAGMLVTSRRQFIGRAGGAMLMMLAGGKAFAQGRKQGGGEFVFLEAEQFADHGGWELDQQSMDQMGSPYLLAHGLGIPVKDAVTDVRFPSAGTYRVWVRTRDWVAPWNAPGAPGKFQVMVDGSPLEETFGTKSATWHWHDGGTVKVGEKATIGLHDLTGFEGRCEAILFCKDTDFQPTDDVAALKVFRRKLLGLPDQPADGGSFDLVVLGGGLAGTSAALSAARQGLKVALVQDRPVLGGNGSSEVRVWPEGKTQLEPFPHVGDIVEEMLPPIDKATAKNKWYSTMNGTTSSNFDDQRKLDVVGSEPRITLLTNHRAMETQTEGKRITAVVIESTLTAEQQILRAKFFADCTGDAKIGFQAGADYEYEFSADNPLMGSSNLFSVLDAAKENEVLKCECKDKSSLMSQYEKGEFEQPFPRCPWALDLSDKPFPGRKGKQARDTAKDLEKFANMWFWESGFDKDQVNDIEQIRDHNFRAMYGAWDALKNVDGLYKNFRLGWVAFIAGKRESRRLMGDVVLDAEHFVSGKEWPDQVFPCTWSIDLHTPKKEFQKGFEGKEFISHANHGKYSGLYWAPYRCLYSRNIDNLFMAGRNISVTKTGIGPIRVMRTCGMMGEIVGKAAAICVKENTSPRGVYQDHFPKMKELMKQPGTTRVG
ncbi:MAG: FAD-dependent oxidoreductase [Akkermansiaceae bacterium]|nr:FAD-dependent oxidoreductase [Akkermansiaceae bacterium]MDP4720236.1 FAD-dependent oxidoreductase [Akkermansiaceae bacterium]MDP4847621.1 FAD-dependent oxidoreductase [Akkermansiaceae bacterium]MDP4898752.1 FAD-dependent oxidoreductase [Akkermansiaceae bacterium]